LADLPHTKIRILLGKNHKLTDKMGQQLDSVIAKHVEKEQKNIKFGSVYKWNDVEADEVDLRRMLRDVDDPNDAVAWEQWGGVVERGRPESLVLNRLNPNYTKLRAPGPGAMTKRDWEPWASKNLTGANVILHTDGARAYKLKLPGMLHDNVVHKKKRIMLNGKSVWVSPHYTKVIKHVLPDTKKTLWVKAGTQIIDRCWRHLRGFLSGRSSRVGSKNIRYRIRFAQWVYWYRNKDLWKEAGSVFSKV
jgi:hypothetical protein